MELFFLFFYTVLLLLLQLLTLPKIIIHFLSFRPRSCWTAERIMSVFLIWSWLFTGKFDRLLTHRTPRHTITMPWKTSHTGSELFTSSMRAQAWTWAIKQNCSCFCCSPWPGCCSRVSLNTAPPAPCKHRAALQFCSTVKSWRTKHQRCKLQNEW